MNPGSNPGSSNPGSERPAVNPETEGAPRETEKSRNDPRENSLLADGSRRADITFYPPVPGVVLQCRKVRFHRVDGEAVEFWDERGNFQRIGRVPYILVSYDPGFDPETEGRIIRTAGGAAA